MLTADKKFFIDEDQVVHTGPEAQKRHAADNDNRFLGINGVVAVDKGRWDSAQRFEKRSWMVSGRDAADDRNLDHQKLFNGYQAIDGRRFESVAELGCGPFTNLRLIAERIRGVKHITLVDPLIEDYLAHPHCTYKDRTLAGIPVTPIASSIEAFIPANRFDLIVMINVLEHCFNVALIFDTILAALAPGGSFIFADNVYKSEDLPTVIANQYDAGHPLRVSGDMVRGFLDHFFDPFFRQEYQGLYNQQHRTDIYFIGQKKKNVPEVDDLALRRHKAETLFKAGFVDAARSLLDDIAPENWTRQASNSFSKGLARDENHPAAKESTPPDSSLFKANLALLEARTPGLAQRLRSVKPSAFCRVIAAENGSNNLFCTAGDNRTGWLHDPKDPVSEAKQMVAGFDFKGEDLTVLMGFGLGYLPLEIIKKMHEKHHLVVVEASAEILASACHTLDLGLLFSDERVHVFLADQLDQIWQVIEQEPLKILGGTVHKLIHPPSFNLFGQIYRQLETEIEAFTRTHFDNFSTLENHRLLWIKNILKNLINMSQAAPVDALFGLAAGRPALVVAAGPSLNKNIDQIREARDRFWIIAVDTALKPLLKSGLQPDLVVAVDPYPANYAKFEGLEPEILAEVPLVFSPLVLPDIPRDFKYRFVFGEPIRFCQWGMSLRPPAAELPRGFTVSHHAFYLARKMGADPIVFAGLDLAFGPDGDHAKNSAIRWEIDTSNPDLPRVPGIDGQPVPTCGGFVRMITLFEREIAKTKATCIDASEGGALIRGTKVMEFKAVAESFKDITCLSKKALVHQKAFAKNDLSPVLVGISWLLDEAGVIGDLCEQALNLHESLPQTGKNEIDPNKTRAHFSKIDALADEVGRHKRFMTIVSDFMGSVMVKQYKNHFELERTRDMKKRHRLQAQNSRIFFERLKEVAAEISQQAEPLYTAASSHLSEEGS